MPKLIDIPGLGEIEFPDDMDDAAIAAEAERLSAEANPAPRKSLGGFLSNAWDEVKAAPGAVVDMVSAAASAVPTLDQAARLNPEALSRVGAFVKAAPGAIASDLSEKYGGVGRALDTAYERPLGTLMDASVLLGGAGAALRGAGSVAKVPGLVRAGQAAASAGRAADPVLGAVKGLQRITPRISTARMQNAGTRMMQSAMKVAKPIQDSNTFNVAEIAARDKIMPTVEGFQQAARNAKQFKQEAIAIARDAERRGQRLSPARIVQALDRKVTTMPAHEMVPDTWANPIADLRDKVWQAHSTPVMAPVSGTQNWKTGQSVMQPTGQRVEVPIKVKRSMAFTENMNDRQNFAKKSALSMSPSESPGVKAEDALRSATRAERERVAPGMNTANEKRGEQIAVMKQLQNYTLRREGNLSPISARTLMGMGLTGGLYAGGAPMGATIGATMLPGIVNSPGFWGKQAIRVYHGDQVINKGTAAMRTGARGATQAGVASDALREALLEALANSSETP